LPCAAAARTRSSLAVAAAVVGGLLIWASPSAPLIVRHSQPTLSAMSTTLALSVVAILIILALAVLFATIRGA
jgi:hypothetical protein